MRVLERIPLLALSLGFAAAAWSLSPSPARADENLLHGPHPFLRDNQLSVHVLVAEGVTDTLSGAKLGFDYGYKATASVEAPVWLDLQFNYAHAGCSSTGANVAVCGTDTGDVIEMLAGARWTFATPIPLVPYVKGGAGLLFAFPNGATNSAGLAIRFAGGANYFFFDWLGLGAEVGFSMGRIDYDKTFAGSHNYAVLDFGGGLEFQF
jgi:hypothetical protein